MNEISLKRLVSLQTRCRKHLGRQHDEQITDSELINFFSNNVVPDLVYSSLAGYRAALKPIIKDPDAMQLLTELKAKPRSEQSKKRTSSLRKKSLSNQDFNKLTAYAWSQNKKNSKYTNGLVAVNWIEANRLTGLRPHEWQFAHLGDDNRLVVENYKLNKTTKKEWLPRIIPLTHLSTKDIDFIKSWIVFFDANVPIIESYEQLAHSCACWFFHANKKLFPRRKHLIGLMTGRHQFIANLKASGRYSPKEIAYLAGHANDLRAYESYSSGKNGDTSIALPCLPPEALATINQISEKFDEKITKTNLSHFIRSLKALSDKSHESTRPM